MATATALPTIPWTHSVFEFGSIWKWVEPHFIVTVNGDDRSCYWQITDMTGGKERPFSDGRTATFEHAEREIREAIGKAYPPRLGYQRYAGNLATTFTVSSGERMDLGPYVGRRVTATVVNPDGTTTEFDGIASIDHYDLVVTHGKKAARISPTYLKGLRVFNHRPLGNVSVSSSRTYPGAYSPGCTGKPGYLPNTVEHDGLICCVHEEP